ncbi:MAG: DUF4093 domain-containing protein [Ruminococcaceae bacterium]|nr:DUF4093 domain-containing protein [Oscillospiraceae bacterium]
MSEQRNQNEKKLTIALPIIVEGRYDREKLLTLVDGQILTTDGFGLFKSEEKQALFRRLSDRGPLIILTDSDGAGKVIRNRFNSMLPGDKLIHLYIPQIEGKERRKKEASKEGYLGVEGMERETLYALLSPFASDGGGKKPGEPITKTDFYADGLSGGANSREKRDCLALKCGLPKGMSSNALLAALNILITREEYRQCLKN